MLKRTSNFILGIFLFILGFGISSAASAEDVLPVPDVAYVTDQAKLLSASQKEALEKELAGFEQKTGSQVALIIVPSTKGEPIESYAHRVGSSWKLGRKSVGDGLLFIVAVNDRKARIDVNRALEGAIPDLTAYRILQESVFPAFKQDRYYDGIRAGLDRIFSYIRAENLPLPSETKGNSDGDPLWDEPWIAIIFIGFVLTMMLRQLLGRRSAPLSGLIIGVFGAFVMQSLWSGVIIALLAVIAAWMIPTEVLEAGARRTKRMYEEGRNDGFGDGGFGGGFGDSDGGMSSGGGGDSAGGGASGGW